MGGEVDLIASRHFLLQFGSLVGFSVFVFVLRVRRPSSFANREILSERVFLHQLALQKTLFHHFLEFVLLLVRLIPRRLREVLIGVGYGGIFRVVNPGLGVYSCGILRGYFCWLAVVLCQCLISGLSILLLLLLLACESAGRNFIM